MYSKKNKIQKRENTKNIVMAGWGTGGHVFPIQSLLEYIDLHRAYFQKIEKIYWVGTKNSLEQERCSDLQKKTKNIQSLHFYTIWSGKYRREKGVSAFLRNCRDLFRFSIWIFQSLFFLLKNNVEVIFCKWWYVALPIVIAGRILRKKIVVHESDTKPWLVNKIASKMAKKVFTGFDNVLVGSETVGQILSENIIYKGSEKAEKLEKGKKPSQKTQLLLVWWSQGAKTLYESVIQANPWKNYEISVILGKENQNLRKQFEKLSQVKIYDFVDQKTMGRLLYQTDIAITRAGTTSLAEQKLYGIKSIIVPIPWTHDQSTNAEYYVNKYQDIALSQKSKNFVEELSKILEHYQNFKKEKITISGLKKEISFAKEQIIKSLLEL